MALLAILFLLKKTNFSDILKYANTGMINDYYFNISGIFTKNGGVGKYSMNLIYLKVAEKFICV